MSATLSPQTAMILPALFILFLFSCQLPTNLFSILYLSKAVDMLNSVNFILSRPFQTSVLFVVQHICCSLAFICRFRTSCCSPAAIVIFFIPARSDKLPPMRRSSRRPQPPSRSGGAPLYGHPRPRRFPEHLSFRPHRLRYVPQDPSPRIL